MIESATRRRHSTGERVTAAAQQLTDERGLDGFTMADLADAAGVSRRTLFNYFPGKVDAVLGEWPGLAEDDVARFRAGGPDHDLVKDLRTLIAPVLSERVTDREVMARFRRILHAEVRLLSGVHERYEELSAVIVGHIAEREGPAFAATRARVAIALLAVLFDSALDDFLADASAPFLHHFDATLHTARSLLGA